jgi:hypothetical protein
MRKISEKFVERKVLTWTEAYFKTWLKRHCYIENWRCNIFNIRWTGTSLRWISYGRLQKSDFLLCAYVVSTKCLHIPRGHFKGLKKAIYYCCEQIIAQSVKDCCTTTVQLKSKPIIHADVVNGGKILKNLRIL